VTVLIIVTIRICNTDIWTSSTKSEPRKVSQSLGIRFPFRFGSVRSIKLNDKHAGEPAGSISIRDRCHGALELISIWFLVSFSLSILVMPLVFLAWRSFFCFASALSSQLSAFCSPKPNLFTSFVLFFFFFHVSSHAWPAVVLFICWLYLIAEI